MRIDRRTPGPIQGGPLGTAVVIDVLRASSTAVVYLSRVPELWVVGTPDDLPRLPPAPHGRLVVSELDSAGPDRIDNSPVKARTVELDGRVPVLVTTNGTRALAACAAHAERVLMAGFVNVSAVAAEIARSGAGHVTIVPAGDFAKGAPHAEDERCADALAALLAGEPADLAGLARSALADARVERRLAREPGLLGDVELSLTPDAVPVVAELDLSRPDLSTGGRLIRCPATSRH